MSHHLGIKPAASRTVASKVKGLIAWVLVAAVIVLVSGRWVQELVSGRQQDFIVYITASRDWLAGRSVYQDRSALPYTYPPLTAILFLPFALMPDSLAMTVWVGGNLALGMWIVRRLFPRQPFWFMALVMLSAPIGRSLYLGQINLVLFALLLLDLIWTRRASGAFVGFAAAIKVTPAFMALTYLLRRDWRSSGIAIGAAAAWTLIAAATRPADSITYWTRLLWDPNRVGGLAYSDNQSITGLLARLLDDPPGWARLFSTGVAIAVAVLAGYRWRRQPGSLEMVTIIGITGLLISPVSWTHHWIWLLTFQAILIRRGHRGYAAALGVVLAVEPLLLAGLLTPLPQPLAAALLSSYTVAGLGALTYLGVCDPPPALCPFAQDAGSE